MAEPAPNMMQVSEAMDRMLQPWKELIAWNDDIQARGGLEQVANEAQARAEAAQRDADAAVQRATDAGTALDARKAQSDADMADAQAKASGVVQVANAQAEQTAKDAEAKAAEIIKGAQEQVGQLQAQIDAANAQAAQIVQDAQSQANVIAGQQADAEQKRDDAIAKANEANNQLVSFQNELAALKARLG